MDSLITLRVIEGTHMAKCTPNRLYLPWTTCTPITICTCPEKYIHCYHDNRQNYTGSDPILNSKGNISSPLT